MMAGIIYTLCALTCSLCAYLLLLGYGRSKYHLLLWSGLCFSVLTINNVLLVVDKILIASIDFSTWRLLAALAAMIIFLYGLIWDRSQ